MLFNSYVFLFVYLPMVLFLWYAIPDKERTRLTILTAASYVFYGYWDWRFCGLMLFSTIIDYICGLKLNSSKKQIHRRFWLILSLTTNLSLLAFFKYWAFGVGNLNSLLAASGSSTSFPIWNIILPVGISFYTFQSMSYSIDIYKDEAKPTKSFLHFAAYVSMFPQLVAGPIVRYHELYEQLRQLPKKIQYDSFLLGCQFFILGLAKKLWIADTIAKSVDPLFMNNPTPEFVTSWLAMVGYTMQIYFDFSGYSDMAVGLGLMLGFQFPQNFNSPYKSTSISDFWRRWHMSFSFWLRDYLYIAMGGNRHGKLKTLRNLMITMFLGGLWHGANWTFVVWGVYHGALLIIHNLWRTHSKRTIPKSLAIAITFIAVMVGWVFFRSPNFTTAGQLLFGLVGGYGVDANQIMTAKSFIVIVILAGFWCFAAPNTWQLPTVNKKWQAVGLAMLFVLCVLKLGEPSPFLYFQF